MRRRAAAESDVLFCPAYTAPLFYPGRLVVATHSVNEIQPDAHDWTYRLTYEPIYRHAARNAYAVIVPAKITRDDVCRAYGIDPARVVIVPQGADDCFRPLEDLAALRAVRTRYFGRDRPFILFVGKLSTRRNAHLLIRAFAALRKERRIPHGLLLFGPNTDGLPLAALCQQLGVSDDVVQTDGVIAEHRDIVPVYNAADVFVHPSEYEGWSMTTVEALACGTAVIAADRGGLGEVAKGHALMLDALSTDTLADAIGRVLQDDGLRADLRSRARARGRALRWEATTRDTLDVIRDVATGRARRSR